MKTIATIATGIAAIAMLFFFFIAALIEVIFRGGKALDCGLDEDR